MPTPLSPSILTDQTSSHTLRPLNTLLPPFNPLPNLFPPFSPRSRQPHPTLPASQLSLYRLARQFVYETLPHPHGDMGV
jgi:hypothetical protein